MKCAQLASTYDVMSTAGSPLISGSDATERPGDDCSGEYNFTVQSIILNITNIEPLLVALSDIYDHIRQLTDDWLSHAARGKTTAQTHEASSVSSCSVPLAFDPRSPINSTFQPFQKTTDAVPDNFMSPSSSIDLAFSGYLQAGHSGNQNLPMLTQSHGNTFIYWFHPADSLKLKLAIMKHKPIFLAQDRSRLKFGHPGSLSDIPFTRDSSLISSVYFEDDQLKTYHNCLQLAEPVSCIRVRWDGARTAGDENQSLFIERTTHSAANTEESSFTQQQHITQVQNLIEKILICAQYHLKTSDSSVSIAQLQKYVWFQHSIFASFVRNLGLDCVYGYKNHPSLTPCLRFTARAVQHILTLLDLH